MQSPCAQTSLQISTNCSSSAEEHSLSGVPVFSQVCVLNSRLTLLLEQNKFPTTSSTPQSKSTTHSITGAEQILSSQPKLQSSTVIFSTAELQKLSIVPALLQL